MIRDGQAAQLTNDGKAKLQAELSPSQDRIAYYEECPEAERCVPSVVLMDLAGRRLSSFRPKPNGAPYCGSINSIAWMGPGAIAADCHINPSLGEYIETDLATRATLRDLFGFRFTPSPDGKHVAHAGWIPHFAEPFAQSNYLQVENTTIYPLPKGSEPVEQKVLSDPPAVVERRGAVFSGIHQFVSGFAWAADSERIALVDCTFDWTHVDEGTGHESNRRCSLAVTWLSGKAVHALLDDMPPDQLWQAKLTWTDSHHVLVQAGGFTDSVSIP